MARRETGLAEMTARFRIFLLGAGGALVLASASPAGAATQLGDTFLPEAGSCNISAVALQVGAPVLTPYTVPTDGVITSWSFQAGADVPESLKFKVADPEGGNLFRIVGESAPQTSFTPGVTHIFQTRIPVEANDVIGFHVVTGDCVDDGATGFTGQAFFGDPAPGTTVTFMPPSPNVKLDVSAVLEADADGDDFGDETQDQCPGQTGSQNGCPPPPPEPPDPGDQDAPDTTITERPKDKTKDKEATFGFNSSEAGSTFECSVDVAQFVPCSSPFAQTVGKGNHTFQVRAIDAAGNVDNSPASDVWEFKKKKKKK
jgi:hypothetical protein